MNRKNNKTIWSRTMLLIGFSCMVLVGYIFRLIFLQLVNGEKYLEKA